MREHVPLEFPLGGVNRDRALSEQPALTTPEGRNMRGRDPVTGRARGGQRSGLRDYSTAPIRPGHPVADVGQVIVDRPRLSFVELTEAGAPGVSPSALATDLQLELEDRSVGGGLAVDRAGNLYVTEQRTDGAPATRVWVYSPAGALVHTIHVPLGDGMTLLPTVAVLTDQRNRDAVYLVGTDVSAFQSRIVRLVKFSEGIYRQSWILPLAAGVYAWALDDELLYVATRHSTGDQEARVGLLAGLEGPEPFFAWQRAVPAPVYHLGVARDGAVLVSSGPNAARGELPAVPGWFAPTELWSPHLLSNAAHRIYYWVDSLAIESYGPGDHVDRWLDRRWLHVAADDAELPPNSTALEPDGSNVFGNVTDTWGRLAFLPTGGFRQAPTYKANAAGVRAGLHFDPTAPSSTGPSTGQMLRSQPTDISATEKTDTTGDGRPDADGDARLMGSALPGLHSISFTSFWVFRATFGGNTARTLASILPTSGLRFGIVLDADRRTVYPSQSNAVAPGRLQLYVSGAQGSVAGGNDELAAADVTPSGAFGNDKGLVILTFHHGGIYPGVNPDLQRSWLRINGRQVDNFEMLRDGPRGGGWTLLGSVYHQGAPDPTVDLWAQSDFSTTSFGAFSGDLLTVFTILGDTSGAPLVPHQVPTTYPNSGGGNGGQPPVPGATHQWSVDQATDEATTNAASEVERLEGWLAHRLGAPDILENGNVPGTVGGYWNNHPFGGSAHPPVGPTGLSSTVPSAYQLALLSTDPVLAKCGTIGGGLAWARADGAVGSAAIGTKSGHVVSVGPKRATSPTDPIVRRFRDIGAVFDDGAAESWTIKGEELQRLRNPAPAVDRKGQVYLPLEGRRARIRLTSSNNNPPSNGSYIDLESGDGTTAGGPTVGAPPAGFIRYEFWAVPTAAYQVAAGTTRAEAAFNLSLAVDGTGTPGTHYFTGTGPVAGQTVLRVPGLPRDIYLQARDYGEAGNLLEYDVQTSGWTAGAVDHLEGGRSNVVRKLDAASGTALWTWRMDGSRAPVAIAMPHEDAATLDEDLEGTPEWLWLTSWDVLAAAGPVDPTAVPPRLEKLRQLARVYELEDGASSRDIVVLGVAGGWVARLRDGQAPELVEGGVGALAATGHGVQSDELYGDRFFTDGVRYAVYRGRTARVEPFEAEGEGEVPGGCRLLVGWNQRLVLAREPRSGRRLYMSARGNPYRWNAYPADPSPTDPIVGNVRLETPDLINALVPGGDDVLYVGGDRFVHVMNGDPGLGGQLDLLSRETGMAFGRPWAQDPQLRVYFVGSKGGLWVIAPGSPPEEISSATVRRDLEGIDLESHEVQLAWNYRDRGLHLFIVPRGAGGERLVHWFWEQSTGVWSTGAWWEDSFSADEIQPTAARAIDGDRSDDRLVLVGCADGRVAAWSHGLADDRGRRIESWVDLVLQHKGSQRMRVTQPAIELAADQGGAVLELLLADQADPREWSVRGPHVLNPGRNPRAPLRGRGGYARLRVSQKALGGRWAWEAGSVRIESAGERRHTPR